MDLLKKKKKPNKNPKQQKNSKQNNLQYLSYIGGLILAAQYTHLRANNYVQENRHANVCLQSVLPTCMTFSISFSPMSGISGSLENVKPHDSKKAYWGNNNSLLSQYDFCN